MHLPFSIPFLASRKPEAHTYHPVPAPDEESLLASPKNKETPILSSKHNFILQPSFWLTAFAVLSIAVTIRNLILLSSPEPHVSYLEASTGSPYNGLEKLIRNESSPSWPLSTTYYPDFVGATEGSYIDHVLNNGSIVRLDSERTVVLQHRVRDYGLDHCVVKLEFSHPTGSEHGHATRGYGHVGESPYLRLWRLEGAESEVVLASSAPPTLLPPRKQFLGNIKLDGSPSARSPSFGCISGSIQTLEIAVACASDPCIVEFRLMQTPQRQGFWIVQSESAQS